MTFLRLILILLFVNSLNAKISLSVEEKEWISENPIIKVGVDSNWPPFDFINKEGKHQGISSDYLNYISLYTGLKLEVYANEWSIILSDIKNKKLDILACAVETKERREYLNFTDSYASVDIVVVAKKDLKLKEFKNIEKYLVALPKDTFIHDKLKKRFPKMKFKFVSSNEEALQTISYGKADIYVGNLPVAMNYIEKYFLTNLEVKFKSEFKAEKLSVSVLKDKKILFSILQKSIQSIPLKLKQEINKKWIFDNNFNKEYINFSEKELTWIKKNPVIRIAGDPHWAPFSYYKDDKYIGIIPDFVDFVKKETGLDIQHIKTEMWHDTINLLKENKIHLIDAIAYSGHREDFLNVSTKYLTSHVVIIGEKNETYISSIKNIKNPDIKKVGVVKGYTITEQIKNNNPDIKNLIYFKTPKDALISLSNSQIDYFIIDIPTFEYYSRKYSLSNLKIVGPTGYYNNYSFGVSKNEPELLSIMTKIIKYIPQSEKDKIYRKWIKVDFEKEIDYELIWQIILIAFMILVGTLYWNRKLKLEIEEKELVQKKLSDSNDFISAIMDSQMDIIVVTDGKDIKQVNQAFLDFFKYKDLEEFKNTYSCICDLFDLSNKKEYLLPSKNDITWIDEILSNPSKIFKTKIIINKQEYIFKVVASKIKSNNILKTAVFHNITELENLHKDLVKAKNSALSAAKHKSEFLANMSHEIRTPMNSVIGFTELLDKEIDNPVQKDYLNSIKRGGNALLGIINDILDLSKIEAGKLDIKKESINPKNLISEVESIFHSKIISKNINFSIDIDENIPDFIIIDSIRIRQVLFNLIGNAIKFTEQGTIKLKVENIYKNEIKSKIDLIISVEDSGIGIDKKDLKNIFNSFEQSDQDESKYGGTGLGLAICSNLVKMMNGEIEVESQKGVGSVFRFRLHNIAVSSLGEQITVKKLDLSNIHFEKATILVVDDIEENRKLVQASLKNFDFKMIMAENGQVALDRLKNIKIDLILMDLRMPVLDGYQTATIIKNDLDLKNIPLIALTASVMGKDLEKVGEYGFDGYLRKPIILDDLIEEMSKYLEFSFLNNILIPKDTNAFSLDKSKLDDILEVLNTALKDKWNDVKDKGDFLLIESFVNELDKIASKEINILLDYVIQLKHNIESFDIEKVDYLMNSYEIIIEEIEKIRRKMDNG